MLFRSAASSESSATWDLPRVLEGGLRLKRTVVEVRMRAVAVGWLLTQRYGPVRSRRWFLREAAADRSFDVAVVAAEAFVEDLCPGLQAHVRTHRLPQQPEVWDG